MELRALCNEVPRTPPGPEGSNGIGIASGAADHPKFLAPKSSLRWTVKSKASWRAPGSENVIMIFGATILVTFVLACVGMVFFLLWLKKQDGSSKLPDDK